MIKIAKIYFAIFAVVVSIIYFSREDYDSCIRTAASTAKTDAGMHYWARLCYGTYKESPRQPRDLFQEFGIIPKPDR